MKRRNTILLSLALPALWAFTAPAGEISFHPEAGTTLTKSFDTTVELSLDEMRMVMNGEEQDASMFGMEMSMTNSSELEFTDTYVAVDSGRPATLHRTFESLGNTTSTSTSNQITGSMDLDVPSASELEGLTVVFAWEEDEGDFVASYPEDAEGDETLLEDLVEDTDLRGFLPRGAVEEGDTWTVEAAYLINLMAPGGDLKLIPEEMEEMPGMGDPTSELGIQDMLGEIEGEVTCEYAGMREGLAAIKVTLEVSSANDLSELIAEKMADAEMPQEGMEVSFDSMDVEVEIEGEGTLLWNVEAGHFASFEFAGDMQQVMEMAMAISSPMGEMDMEQTITMSGNLNFVFEASEE